MEPPNSGPRAYVRYVRASFHHRLVRSQGRVGKRGIVFLARWPTSRGMQHARDQIKDLTLRSRLRLSVEVIVADVNRFLRGWAAYLRYGNRERTSTRSETTPCSA